MPNQPYIELLEYDADQIDIVDQEILESDDDYAVVKFVINKIYDLSLLKLIKS